MARLFLDMDGTLARFHDQAHYLERMFEEGFFAELEPFENMVAGVKLFMEQHPDIEVYIISSCVESQHCIADKNKWLDEHLNIPNARRLFPPIGSAKADCIPGGVSKDDYLVDDYNRGLNQFLYDGGSAIKCHNNINQRGLGAHGGSAGNLWVGAMVHTEDKPEMIAAELAQHMGLEYDINRVAQAYPEIDISYSPEKCNLLNEIRFLSGKEDFYDHAVDMEDGSVVYAPGHLLRAVCMNVYDDENFLKRLCNDALHTFSRDVGYALQRATMPIVGRLDFPDPKGGLDHSVHYYSQAHMEQALKNAWDAGVPVHYTWYVNTKPLSRETRETAVNSLAEKIAKAEQRSAAEPEKTGPGDRERGK